MLLSSLSQCYLGHCCHSTVTYIAVTILSVPLMSGTLVVIVTAVTFVWTAVQCDSSVNPNRCGIPPVDEPIRELHCHYLLNMYMFVLWSAFAKTLVETSAVFYFYLIHLEMTDLDLQNTSQRSYNTPGKRVFGACTPTGIYAFLSSGVL